MKNKKPIDKIIQLGETWCIMNGLEYVVHKKGDKHLYDNVDYTWIKYTNYKKLPIMETINDIIHTIEKGQHLTPYGIAQLEDIHIDLENEQHIRQERYRERSYKLDKEMRIIWE